jgi:ribosome-binding protein aMBF1 (putative translation factor)
MKELLLSRTNKNLCPICNKPTDKDCFTVDYNGNQLKVCKTHIKYGGKDAEKNNSQLEY